MESDKYLIIFEIERIGFIIDSKINFEVSKSIADRLFDLYGKLSYTDFLAFLNKSNISSYSINGNIICAGKIDYGHCDGIAMVSVVMIESKGFCLKTFIKERQNYSLVFSFDDYEEELERMAEKFPKLNIVAN